MNIIIDKDAADYIKKHSKDNSVTLLLMTSKGGWCSTKSPTVLLGKAQNADNYDVHKIDDINVYTKKDIKVINNELHIYLRKLFWIKELEVEGMRINY